jgi:hypothetical protein
MTNFATPSVDTKAFLREHSGVYTYNRWIVRVFYWLGVCCLLGTPLMLVSLLSEPANTIRQVIDLFLMLFAMPCAVWLFLGFGMGFHRLEISEEGILISPIGLSIPAAEITASEIVERGTKMQRIKLGVSSPKLSLHMFVWSFGRTVKIVFNENLLKTVDSH